MIKLENTEVYGWCAAIRGMRNPLNSWDKSDSDWVIVNEEDHSLGCDPIWEYQVGEADIKLMKTLSKAGSDHGKFLRMINVTVDITAPWYWWKEFDTYKVGTVANSCSTMHKLTEKEFELDDFSHDHLTPGSIDSVLKPIIVILNSAREAYLKFEEFDKEAPDGWDEGIECKKDIWWQMIQLLPSSYNQKRTVQLNYQVLKSMYFARRNHKLDEWHEFCAWCESLPYFKEICLNE
jgi:hypothetical protein